MYTRYQAQDVILHGSIRDVALQYCDEMPPARQRETRLQTQKKAGGIPPAFDPESCSGETYSAAWTFGGGAIAPEL
jgi:hypothetical protein